MAATTGTSATPSTATGMMTATPSTATPTTARLSHRAHGEAAQNEDGHRGRSDFSE
jgi:hypothetical protein